METLKRLLQHLDRLLDDILDWAINTHPRKKQP